AGGTSMRLFRIVTSTTFVVVAATSALAQTGGYRSFGDASGFLNIVPPGQDGVLHDAEAAPYEAGTIPPHVIDQLSMYGDLVYNAPGLTEDRIEQFFKDA